MVSHPDVQKRLHQFVCVRLDWEQMMRAKDRYGFKVPTQGNQVLLDPKGKYIAGISPTGQRYPIPEFLTLLDLVHRDHPPRAETRDDLRLTWFLFRKEKRPGGDASFLSKIDRKPVLTIHGRPPTWIEERSFLEKHLRQFVWTQEPADSPRISIEMFEPDRRVLASFDLAEVTPAQAGERLDSAWVEYMKVRPMLARGYIDNPHGNWLKNVMEKVHQEEVQVREQALKGLLSPPGRSR